MPRNIKIGLNPLPWVLTPAGFDLSMPILRTGVGEIATTPFRAIQADPPAGLNAAEYRQLLAEFGLEPAPGYFSASFHTETAGDIVEAAKRHARCKPSSATPRSSSPPVSLRNEWRTQPLVPTQARRPFAASSTGWVRLLRPSPPKESPPAAAPHVGSTVETEPEVRAVLDAIPSSDLSFGPDIGHLAWAGMTPSKIMADYADRIVAMHLKDVHLDQASSSCCGG
jgi:inosose dehydratase